jgi:hypothetical protein
MNHGAADDPNDNDADVTHPKSSQEMCGLLQNFQVAFYNLPRIYQEMGPKR